VWWAGLDGVDEGGGVGLGGVVVDGVVLAGVVVDGVGSAIECTVWSTLCTTVSTVWVTCLIRPGEDGSSVPVPRVARDCPW
jgi:hypothetical protein